MTKLLHRNRAKACRLNGSLSKKIEGLYSECESRPLEQPIRLIAIIKVLLLKHFAAAGSTRWKNPACFPGFSPTAGRVSPHSLSPRAVSSPRYLRKTNDAWIKAAVDLGQQAICRSLDHAGISPEDISAIFFASVTGISSPTVDARLINRLPFSVNIKRTPIFGLGCVAGAAGISRASDYVRAFPDQYALLLSVELCSLTWQDDDQSIANLISCGLFGDGAAAVVVAGADTELDARTEDRACSPPVRRSIAIQSA